MKWGMERRKKGDKERKRKARGKEKEHRLN